MTEAERRLRPPRRTNPVVVDEELSGAFFRTLSAPEIALLPIRLQRCIENAEVHSERVVVRLAVELWNSSKN